jgi:hypothetical protein
LALAGEERERARTGAAEDERRRRRALQHRGRRVEQRDLAGRDLAA